MSKGKKTSVSNNNDLDAMKSVKLVVIGDGSVGKTCLLIRFAEDRFEENYIPTIFDHKSTMMKVNNRVVDLNLWDTAGQEELDRLRPLSYPDSDIFLLCFSLDFPTSFNNIKLKWYPEVQHHKPGSPIVIVGTKLDLVTNSLDPRIQKQYATLSKKAESYAKEIKAVAYIECSARDKKNYSKPFEVAVRAVLNPKPVKSKGCSVL